MITLNQRVLGSSPSASTTFSQPVTGLDPALSAQESLLARGGVVIFLQ